jgi:hypothetical protein
MVHPVTGKTISSYKKLMNDPDMAVIWQTTFGNFFGLNVAGGQQNWTEKHKCNVCHEPQGNTSDPQGRQEIHLRKPGG